MTTRRVTTLAAAFAILMLHLGSPPTRRRPHAVVVVFDVGQGQAVAWLGPSGDPVLVDAGPSGRGSFDAGERIVVPGIGALGHRRLAALVLTHDDDDHSGGARAVLRELEVGELWIPLGSLRDAGMRSIADDAVALGVALRLAERGASVVRAGSRAEFLHPSREDRDATENDRGAVVRFIAPEGASAIVLGDLGGRGEAALLRSGLDVGAGLLVAAHHGAATSTSERLVAATHPAFAAISVGKGNRFGHPSEAVLRRLRAAIVLRTDVDGLLRFTAAGGGWTVEPRGRRAGWGGE